MIIADLLIMKKMILEAKNNSLFFFNETKHLKENQTSKNLIIHAVQPTSQGG